MFLFLLEDYLIWDTTNITFPETNYDITSIYHPKNEYIKNKKTLSTLKSFCNNKMISYFNHIYNLKTTSEPNVVFVCVKVEPLLVRNVVPSNLIVPAMIILWDTCL